MDWHVERFLNRLSLFLSFLATLSLLHLFTRSSLTCTAPPPNPTHVHIHNSTHHRAVPVPVLLPGGLHPNSSCDLLSRAHLSPESRLKKLLSSSSFSSRVSSLSSLFQALETLKFLSNSSRVLAVSAGAGHAAVALNASGVADVTAVDVIDLPPLVRRADPHNLPFFDGVFDLAFSDGLSGALFPEKYVEEMERTVRAGGAEAVVVERDGAEEARALFRRSSLVAERNVKLGGAEMVMLVMRNNGKNSSSPP
ncbi:Uncharacterized protein M6B38_245965 [Iris pallida]|uniref:Methyltransferase type 11 domain-containing protein n=1 Tax=Iris pallida TaxID=29817 RepID=A0AAX6DHD8_IRIPA|nr:Uncharacterized protein M6B38_245965 [Iris pallida]